MTNESRQEKPASNAWRRLRVNWPLWLVAAILAASVCLRQTNVITSCVRQGNLTLLTNLVEWFPGLINRQDRWGMTPLFCAARNGNLPAFELLLEHGASTDLKEIKGFTVEQRLQAPAFGNPAVKGRMLELIAEANAERRRQQPDKPLRLHYPGER
jgi:hypothetical protein